MKKMLLCNQDSVRPTRGRAWFALVLAGGVAALLAGCAEHKQIQFFRVRDPNTGAANYYRLAVTGSGGATKYNFQAGYYSAASVDVLRGSMPNLPTLDLPVERVTNYDRILNHIDNSLWQAARQIAPITDPGVLAQTEEQRVHQARSNLAKLAGDLSKTQEQFTALSNSIAENQKRLPALQGAVEKSFTSLTNLQRTVAWAKTNDSAIVLMSPALVRTITTNILLTRGETESATLTLSQVPSSDLLTTASATNAVLAGNLTNLLTAVGNALDTLGGAPAVGGTNLLNFAQLTLLSNQLASASALGDTVHTNLASASNTLATLVANTNVATNALVSKPIALALGHLLRAATNLDLTSSALSNALQYVKTAPRQDSNTVVGMAEHRLTGQQAQYQLDTNAVAEQRQLLENLKAEQTGLQQTLLSILAERDFELERQTNAAQAAFRLEQMDTQARLTQASAGGFMTNPPPAFSNFTGYENQFMELARLLWFNSLSGADIISVGMTKDTNPQNFRKLVFWAKSQTDNMDQVFGSIDDVVNQVVAIGDTYKKVGAQRAAATANAEAMQQARKASAIQALQAIVSANPTNSISSITNILEMLLPTPVTQTNQAQLSQ